MKRVIGMMLVAGLLLGMGLSARAAGSYLIDFSDICYISEQDVQDFSIQELCYARNEIYARHGRLFQSIELTDYFGAQPWYSGFISPENFQDSELSEIERTNAEFLRNLEFSIKSDGYRLDQPGYDIFAVRTMRESSGEAVLTEEEASTAVTNYFIEQYIEGYILPDAEHSYTYWITYRTTGIKVKFVVDPESGDTYEYGPYAGVNMPMGDNVEKTYLFNAFDYLGDAETYKTGLVSDEKMQSMKRGNVEYLGTWFYLDFDGDGVSENVSFLGSGPFIRSDYTGMDYCRECMLFVEPEYIEQTGDNIRCGVYGVSLDGEHIWLVLMDEGPSSDPVCTFYSYESGSLKKAGVLADTIDHISVTTNGLINGRVGCRVWDTALIEVCWQLDTDGTMSQIPQEYYRMEHHSEDCSVTLMEPITVYLEMDEQSQSSVMQPQKVTAFYTDAVKWVYLVGEDGVAGWINMDTMNQFDLTDIFYGLHFAD